MTQEQENNQDTWGEDWRKPIRSWRTQKVILYLENNLTEEQTQKLVTLIQQADDPLEELKEWFRDGQAPQKLYNELNAMPTSRHKEVIDWQDVLDTYLLDKDITVKGKKKED